MINPQHLRLGNWVYPNNENATPYPVLEIRKKNITCYIGNKYCPKIIISYTDLEPISITPEVLLACGFELNEDAGNWNEPDYVIYGINGFEVGIIENACYYYKAASDDYYSLYHPSILSLHQLQNLYFELTWEELIYNPSK